MQESRNDEKTLKREEDNLRSAGFPPVRCTPETLWLNKKKKKVLQFDTNDQEP